MLRLEDFNDAPRLLRTYGGNAGRKISIMGRDGEPWMVKFPEPTRWMRGNIASYITSPLSEWLGSHIYEDLDIQVHKTKLGFCEGKLVCACRDFTYPDLTLHEFHDVKNSVADESEGYEGRPSDGSNLYLADVLTAIKSLPHPFCDCKVEERFWDMFVCDGFIGNADRNNGNWGFLSRGEEFLGLAPVYDNGNSFFNKRRDSTTENRLENERLMEQDAVNASISCYKDQSGHRISPMSYISEAADNACMRAVGRFLNRINLDRIWGLIDSLPESALGMEVMPSAVKEFHKEILTRRVNDILCPAYLRWRESQEVIGSQSRNSNPREPKKLTPKACVSDGMDVLESVTGNDRTVKISRSDRDGATRKSVDVVSTPSEG